MLELIPPYLREYSEIKAIMSVEEEEITAINNTHNQLVDNRYITSCNENGIKRFESLLGITPLLTDTLEDRKLRCITKINQKLPYNYHVLKQKLHSLCGENGYSLNVDFPKQSIKIELALGVKNQFDIVKGMIDDMVPCNMIANVELMYNTHEILSRFTHSQLSVRTHEEMRSEVM